MSIGVIKSSNVAEAIVGDIITYSLAINNTSGNILQSVVVKDLLDQNLNFVEKSIKLDGFPMPNANILTGVEIAGVGGMGIDASHILTFQAEIVGKTEEKIANQSTVVYTYLEDGLSKIETQDSNIHEVLVEVAQVEVSKVADKEEVSLGDIISYRIKVHNTGTISVMNIIFTDILSESVVLLADSFKVNGEIVNDVDLKQGVNIGALAIDGETLIDYQVKVIGGSCSGCIANEAWVIYNYVLPNTVTGVKRSNIAEICIPVHITSFKQLTIDKNFVIPAQKPDIEEVDDVSVEIIIEDSYTVNTFQAVSNEGQQLSGYKLIIHGKLKLSMEYTALLPTQPMHSAHCELPFSTFLILPPDYQMGEHVEVATILENVDVDMIDRRGAVINIVFLVIAKTNY